ncbi:hypothetical protein Q4595_00305 [Wenyingzhuangia sp. 1_MG-2023]|nr:hypothetical protein [Wenyingzhuangia sp. 1_MG-2023]
MNILKTNLFLLLILILNSCIKNEHITTKSCSDEQLVSIPDPEFEQILINQNIDSDRTINGKILKSDAEKVRVLDLNKEHNFGSIEDLTGVEEFKNLTKLIAISHQITRVDLSQNTLLDTLYLMGNRLKEISFFKNPNLKLIDVQANELETIKGVFYVTSLKKLNASYNNLEYLNIANVTIETLHVSHNLLKELTVTSATRLKNILAASNKLTPTLNVTNNTDLETLLISDNQLLEINLEHNTELTHFYSSSNQLNSLNVSYNQKLVDLKVDRNPNLTCIQKGVTQNIPYLTLSDHQTIGSDCN